MGCTTDMISGPIIIPHIDLVSDASNIPQEMMGVIAGIVQAIRA